jgi:hypothetical protein
MKTNPQTMDPSQTVKSKKLGGHSGLKSVQEKSKLYLKGKKKTQQDILRGIRKSY